MISALWALVFLVWLNLARAGYTLSTNSPAKLGTQINIQWTRAPSDPNQFTPIFKQTTSPFRSIKLKTLQSQGLSGGFSEPVPNDKDFIGSWTLEIHRAGQNNNDNPMGTVSFQIVASDVSPPDNPNNNPPPPTNTDNPPPPPPPPPPDSQSSSAAQGQPPPTGTSATNAPPPKDTNSEGQQQSATDTPDTHATQPGATNGSNSGPTRTSDQLLPLPSDANTASPSSPDPSDPSPTGSQLTATSGSGKGKAIGLIVGLLIGALILCLGAWLFYRRYTARSRPISFNRDMMVRQRASLIAQGSPGAAGDIGYPQRLSAYGGV